MCYASQVSFNTCKYSWRRVGAVWPSWLRERHDPRGQEFKSPPGQSFAKMQDLVLAEPRDYTAESVLVSTQGSLRKSSAARVRFYCLYTDGS